MFPPTRGVHPDDYCIEWAGAHDGNGYAYSGRERMARTIAGLREAPRNIVVDHLCDNSGCVRYDHLEVVTQGENMRRGRRGVKNNPSCPTCGQTNKWKMKKGGTGYQRYCPPCWYKKQRQYKEGG